MELAADSISVKVSEAIMHMQENSVSISNKARKGAKKKKHLFFFFIIIQLDLPFSYLK